LLGSAPYYCKSSLSATIGSLSATIAHCITIIIMQLSYMKNIIAKGGIEFLAVLIGITSSLWIDDYSTSLNDKKQGQEALVNISVSLNQDLKHIDWVIRDLNNANTMLDSMIYNFNSLSKDSIASYLDRTNMYLVFSPRISTYETLKNTGQLYKISDLDILKKIVNIYDMFYKVIEDWSLEDKRNILLLQDHLIENYDIVPSDIWIIKFRDLDKEYYKLKNDQKLFNYLSALYGTKKGALENINWAKKRNLKVLTEIDLSKKNMDKVYYQ
jgi:hypothetical protein